MCSRYSLTSPHEAVRQYFGYGNEHAFPPRYNIAPSQPVAIVRPGQVPGAGRELALVRWGLIPSWVKDPARISMMFNARGESAADKPSFRGGMRHKRCLVPADCFYEWLGEKGHKRPFLVRRKDRGLMAFAGIWDHWLGADGSEIETMAILTVRSNGALSWLHDRMPAIVASEQFDDWLDTRHVLAEAAAEVLQPAADDILEAFEVSKALNNPRAEGADLQTPAK